MTTATPQVDTATSNVRAVQSMPEPPKGRQWAAIMPGHLEAEAVTARFLVDAQPVLAECSGGLGVVRGLASMRALHVRDIVESLPADPDGGRRYTMARLSPDRSALLVETGTFWPAQPDQAPADDRPNYARDRMRGAAGD
jgi:hypothetical protein